MLVHQVYKCQDFNLHMLCQDLATIIKVNEAWKVGKILLFIHYIYYFKPQCSKKPAVC